MRVQRRLPLVTWVVLALLVAGCAPAAQPDLVETEPPAVEPTSQPDTPLARAPCGDGICDELEQKNPDLCPQDCPPTPEPATPTVPTPPPTDTATPEPTIPPDTCGDGVCDEAESKDPHLCPEDCATPTPEAAITVEVTEAPTAAPSPTPTPPPTPTPTEAVQGRASTTTATGELAFVGDPDTVEQEGATEAEQPQSNVALILDGSGSMGENLRGSGQTKLAVAKEVMAELIPQIPAELNGALWIYAHRYPPQPKAESCKDIEEVFPLGPVDAGSYVQTIQGIKANGWTPIADSIVAAAESLPPGDFNSVILVSDGEETCGGDPCAVAEALKDGDVGLTVHVVGYAVDDATREQLECIAAASGGSYHDATDAEGLLRALEGALEAAIVETVLRVEVEVPDGTQEQAALHLYEAGTDRLLSDYAAWKDNVVPPGDYDLVVDTLPKLAYEELSLPEGSTTIVRIILSAIHVLTPDGREDSMVDILGTGGERLTFGYGGTFALVPSTYQVRVNDSVSPPIPLDPGELVELRLGTIRVLTPEGREDTMVDILDEQGERLTFGYGGTFELMPNTYYVRVRNSVSQPLSLGSGEMLEVRLGAIQVLTPDGSADTMVDLLDEEGEKLDSGYAGTFELVPGTYHLRVNDTQSQAFALSAGETVEFQLGAIQAAGSFELVDEAGNRLGSGRRDTAIVVPGTYTVKLEDGTLVEKVVVEPGQVAEVK